MDYKELVSAIRLCGSEPNASLCKKCLYWAGGDMSKCIPRMTEDAATVITDLIFRAEVAEEKCNRLDESRERANESAHMWESRCKMLEERAENAEKERDEYFEHLKGFCFCCKHRTDGFDCQSKCYGHKRGSAWVYAGKKRRNNSGL